MSAIRPDVAGLVRDLGDDVAEVRETAFRALLACDGKVVEELLLRVVSGRETSVVLRRGAARVLHLLSLRRELGHVRGYVRERAIRVLAGLGEDAQVALWPALESADPIVRSNARRALDALAAAGGPPAR